MKCPKCGGYGKVDGWDGWSEYDCEVCDGKGYLTEQEYIQNCDTEQLAEVLSNISTDAWFAGLNDMDRPVGQKDNWQQWLKQPHHEKE